MPMTTQPPQSHLALRNVVHHRHLAVHLCGLFPRATVILQWPLESDLFLRPMNSSLWGGPAISCLSQIPFPLTPFLQKTGLLFRMPSMPMYLTPTTNRTGPNTYLCGSTIKLPMVITTGIANKVSLIHFHYPKPSIKQPINNSPLAIISLLAMARRIYWIRFSWYTLPLLRICQRSFRKTHSRGLSHWRPYLGPWLPSLTCP